MVTSTNASKQNTSEAVCVGCARVWGCEDMGVISGDSIDLGVAKMSELIFRVLSRFFFGGGSDFRGSKIDTCRNQKTWRVVDSTLKIC